MHPRYFILDIAFIVYCASVIALSVSLLHEAMQQDESTELCFIFRSAHSVLYLPMQNIVSRIKLCPTFCNLSASQKCRWGLYAGSDILSHVYAPSSEATPRY